MNQQQKPTYHQTKLGKFEFCAYAYYLEEIEGKRGYGSFYSCRGGGFHTARRVNLKQKIESYRDLPVGDLLDAARDDVTRRVMEDEIDLKSDELSGLGKKTAIDKILKNTLPMVRLDHERLQSTIQPYYVEKFFDLSLPNYPFDVAGTLDTYTIARVLIDAKTSKARWSQQKAQESYQPPLYSLGIRALTEKLPAGFEFHVLVALKKQVLACRIPLEVSEKMIFSVILRFEAMHKAILAGVFPPSHRSSWKCSPAWCEHYRYCKYVQK